MPFSIAGVCVLLSVPGYSAIGPLPDEIHSNWGEPQVPEMYWTEILPGARAMSLARQELQQRKPLAASQRLEKVRQNRFWGDHALLELARLKKRVGKTEEAKALLLQLGADFPNSALQDQARIELAECDFQAADRLYQKFKRTKGAQAAGLATPLADLYRRGLARLKWAEWDGYEAPIARTLEALQAAKSPFADNFTSEALNALSAASTLRTSLLERIPANDRDRILRLARSSPGTLAKSGTKAIQPDEELFKNGLDQVFQKRWQEALETFQTFVEVYPDSVQADRAHYWVGVALENLGQQAKAKTKFVELNRDFPLTFAGTAGALRAALPFADFFHESTKAQPRLSGNLLPQQLEYLWRARALSQVGWTAEARQEMDALFRFSPGGTKLGQASAAGSLALGILFAENAHYSGAFFHLRTAIKQDANILSLPVVRQFFPKPFAQEVETNAKRLALNPLLVYSIAKQESAFAPEATSHARALGLMQVMLATGRGIQADVDRKSLLDPKRNVQIGAEYFAKLLSDFDGNIALALAAYNAGPSRARRWWKEWQSLPIFGDGFRADAFIELIPIPETKDYVASILRNYVWYRYLDGESLPQTVDNLVISPRKAVNL